MKDETIRVALKYCLVILMAISIFGLVLTIANSSS